MAGAVGTEVLVVQRVLARLTNGAAMRHRRVAEARDGSNQLAERLVTARVAPREVVEQGDVIGVGTDRDDVADGLVDHGCGHALRDRARRTTG